MKCDISADFHAPAKRFSGVRAQAGRVLTDADFNAAFDVLDDTLETLVRTLLCAAGSPDSGLMILDASPVTVAAPDGAAIDTFEFTAAPGTFVLGGRATVLNAAIGSLEQSDWLSLILAPGDLPPAPVAGRHDLVWLEQIEGAVRAVEDREIHERALGSADTTTRIRPQLKLRVLDDVPPECDQAAVTLVETLRTGGHDVSDDRTELLSAARLGMAFVDDGPVLDPCAPGGSAGYLGAENQTLKIMLTAPDRFVWAYDHGEPLYRVQVDAALDEIEFVVPPKDPMLYPLPGQVIEILPWDVLLPNGEKAAAPLGHLARVTGHFDPRTNRIAYDGSMPPEWQTWLDTLPSGLLGRDDDPERFFFARIWQAPTAGAGTDEPTGAGIVLPETGVALHFDGDGLAGDYWTASLRPNAPELIHPWNLMIDPAAGDVPHAPPIGPRRFFVPLALISWPASLAQSPEIDDCRNRFRRLCRIKGCCTYQVGDGRISFGDFNDIQEAVNALPDAGGEICLLPGTHDGRIDLRGRRNIKVHGCGNRTLIEVAADAADPDRPAVALGRNTAIQFCDFAISCETGPVFAGVGHCSDIAFTRLTIRANHSAAIALLRSRRIAIRECDIAAAEVPRALEAADIAGLLPLVVLSGADLRIESNRILAADARNRNRVALGGIQIGGRSSDVVIDGNRIEGGNGHGITLGSLRQERQVNGGDIVITFPPWLTVDDDGCLKFEPGGTIELPGGDGTTAPRSEGPIRRLRIRDNLIHDHGGCGISVVHWFIARDDDPVGTLDDIEIDEVDILDNKIARCMEIDLVSALPVEAAFNSGYGGIALASATDITIADNEIRDCGGGRSPICGIYIRYAERLRISGNRISDNGRPASLTDPLLVGTIGGIVVGHVDGVEEGLGQQVREVPAAIVTGNSVVTPEGRALELIGSGQMMVQSNALTSHGNNIGGVILMLFLALLTRPKAIGSKITTEQLEGQFRAAISQIGGSAVLILNTGVNRNIALFAAAASVFLDTNKKASLQGGGGDGGEAIPGIVGTSGFEFSKINTGFQSEQFTSDVLFERARIDVGKALPRGPVSFADNMVTFDAISTAFTLSLCSIAILSLDDVGMHDNHAAIDLTDDIVLANALVVGLASCRLVGNRFREILPIRQALRQTGIPNTIFSAISFGLLNATEMNQGTHCFLALGFKKPRIIIDTTAETPRAYLDTNRHMLSDKLCATFLSISSAFGTD